MSTKPPSPQVGPRIFVAVLILGIAILWFKRDPTPHHNIQPSPTNSDSRELAPIPDTAQPATDSSPTVRPKSSAMPIAPPQSNLPPENFAEEYRRCFPERASSNSVQDFVRDLVVSPDLISREMSSENLYIIEGGVERRLNVYENGPMYDVREFDVDADGVSIPKDDPQTLSRSEVESYTEEFQRRGKTTYQQRKEVIILNDGVRGELDWQDDKIRDLMLFRADRSLFCREGQCQCKLQSSDTN